MAIKTRIAKLEKIVNRLPPEVTEDFEIWGIREDGIRFQVDLAEDLGAVIDAETFTDGEGKPLSIEYQQCMDGLRGALREMASMGQL